MVEDGTTKGMPSASRTVHLGT